ncbi:MAG TPA: AMP-binding protein [Anaeromyxobacteraceae bacterium]|jgi:long-chain acyl-CoA synthetase|nr:AMP-binding protein [Anaeromyxobacteraceae bacterium]
MSDHRHLNGHRPHAPSPSLPRSAGEGEEAPGHPLSPRGGENQGEGAAPLDVAAALRGRALLLTGATGFVGKVTLSMLLHRYPEVGRIFVLVRPGTGGSAETRFFEKVAVSRPFDPLREVHGDGFDRFLREKCVPLAGDVTAPLLGLAEADLARLAGLDLVVNCAGLVDFNPSLDLALKVNARGAGHAADLCRRTGAALLHVSTCYVAGNRDGVIFEDEPIAGFFPRHEGVAARPKEPALDPRDFELAAELADCERRIARVREEAEDRVNLSTFREAALDRLRAEGRDPADEKSLRLAVGREKRLWISRRLVELGMERARRWGWPNTYTFTKSLGEQQLASAGVRAAIVRPSIVESALRYPFPGWNEGFTTSAPLAFIGLEGHRTFPAAEKLVLDVVPVDLVAAGLIAVAADLLAEAGAAPAAPPPLPAAGGEGQAGAVRVFHLATGDVNPLWMRRCVDLTGLYRRRFYKEREEGSRAWNELLSRFEPYPVSRGHYQAFSAPALRRLAQRASALVREGAPRWGAPRLSALAGRLADGIDEVEAKLARTEALWDLYLPFVWENKYVFRCAGIRALHARLSPADRARIPWDPEKLDWRVYWLDVHMKGMEEWVFPGLEEESRKKVHPVKQHRDLLELLDAACEAWPRRTALRMTGSEKERFTFAELRALAERTARFLAAEGVAKGERVLLACENRPEWAAAWFGIVRAGAVAVPVDAQLSALELEALARASSARLALLSEEVASRLEEPRAIGPARAVHLAAALAGGSAPLPPRAVSPDDAASLIFTSGTTGTPKGVLLSHRNFTALVTRLAGLFDIGPGDGLLSVLPLHHTFEFACGLLTPLSRGAEVEYLDELTADSLGEALASGRVTAMIGVPALWSLLHRRITQELSARPGAVEDALRALMKGNAALRDELGVNLGKLLFWPVHHRMGGRLRILVSGGSALQPEVQRAFHELGFDLYEGYGLTEAAPVLAVSTPEDGARAGSVGRPLPGVELRIDAPGADGVGEVLARGPNVMLGYFQAGAAGPEIDRALTAEVLEGGWLRTGDLGRLDLEGRLTLVGRKKDVIIDADGKNVHPDEIEELYRDDGLFKELSVVGLPEGGGEKVALLAVPERAGRDREEVRRLVEAHLRKVSAGLPFPKRVKVWHLVDEPLPRTSTRKVRRKEVAALLRRLEDAGQKGKRARAQAARGSDGWLLDLVAEVSRRPRGEVAASSRLAGDLGFDSLMHTELTAALEEAGAPAGLAEQASQAETVGDLSRLLAGGFRREGAGEEAAPPAAAPEEVPVPPLVAALGRKLLAVGQRALYREAYGLAVTGAAYVPHDRNFLVVANHSSHLDMGLVKVALGDAGDKLAALAAKDYFFDTRWKRAYFENFTNLIPMERTGSVRRSLRAAEEALRRGYNVLIFPEGTRSRDGAMAPFKATAGYLALTCGVDVLPLYIRGTHEALPPGSFLPRRATLEVRIGQPVPVAELRRRTEALPRGDAHKAATQLLEEAVRRLGGLEGGGARADHPLPGPPPQAGEGEGHPRAEVKEGEGHPRAQAGEGAPPLPLSPRGGEGQGEGVAVAPLSASPEDLP